MEKEISASISKWKVFKFVFQTIIKSDKKSSVWRIILTFIGTALTFFEFGLIGLVVNEFVTRGLSGVREPVLIGYVILILLADLIPSILSLLEGYYANIQRENIDLYYDELVLNKMSQLDVATIEDPEFQNIFNIASKKGWGGLFSIIDWFHAHVRNITKVILATVSVIIVSPFAALVLVAGTLPGYFFQRKESFLSTTIWAENSEHQRSWYAKRGSITNKNPLVELKNFQLVSTFIEKINQLKKVFHNRILKLHKQVLTWNVVGEIINSCAYGAAFIILLFAVFEGRIQVGTLVFFYSALFSFQGGFSQIMRSLGRIEEHARFVAYAVQVLETKPFVADGNVTLKSKWAPEIVFESVSFTYPGGNIPVLSNISFRIKPGEHVAIVGLNGAGKTTLLKLLMRVYDPTSGVILVDGKDLKTLSQDDWRSALAILMQDYYMFVEETLGENIRLGDEKIHNTSRIHTAAQQSSANLFIKQLPRQYEEKFGREFRGGIELSKGERQKIALARTLYRKGNIVVLDEPTASVDAVSEDIIFRSLLEEKDPNQTLIVVSHKFSNVRKADRIFVIGDSKIIEQGSHDQLMQFDGEYAKLFRLQAEGYKD